MSGTDLAYGYAQARLQARFSSRPVASDWQHIAATRDLGAVLQIARGNALARWTSRLPPRPDVHEIERRLRDEWLQAVDEVADWQPEQWREGTRWMRWVTYLPALQKLARGGRAPAWMRADPILGPIVAREPRERAAALAHTPLAPLAAGFTNPPDMRGAWTRHWQSLWPDDRAARAPLERLLARGSRTSRPSRRRTRRGHVGGFLQALAHQPQGAVPSASVVARRSGGLPGPARARAAAAAWRAGRACIARSTGGRTMMLRPASANWFELLTSREELGAVLDCLAATGSVQLQAYSRSDSRLALPDLRTTLADYETLARRYGHFWPRAERCTPGPEHELLEAPREALEQVRAWAAAADPLIAELEDSRRPPRKPTC